MKSVFSFCNGLRTRENSTYQSKQPTAIQVLILTYCLILETKEKEFGNAMEKKCGYEVRDFR